MFSEEELKWIEANQELINQYPENNDKLKDSLFGLRNYKRLHILIHYLRFGPAGFIMRDVGRTQKLELDLVSYGKADGNWEESCFATCVVKTIYSYDPPRPSVIENVPETEVRKNFSYRLSNANGGICIPKDIADKICNGCKIEKILFTNKKILRKEGIQSEGRI